MADPLTDAELDEMCKIVPGLEIVPRPIMDLLLRLVLDLRAARAEAVSFAGSA